MSVLTLVRHAQASFLADNYDELSALGREQAQSLGAFWVSNGIDFDEVYCGPRVRHRDTAAIVGTVFTGAGRSWPDPVVLEELDEYDLGSLLQHLAPDLSRRDAAFADLQEGYRRNRDGPERTRSFQRMFEALTLHWATTSCAVAGVEEFAGFRDRVERGLNLVMEKPGSGRRVVLFTSGGFIGASISRALDAPDRMALELSWRLRNSSLTEIVFTRNRRTLDSFNLIPHLEDRDHWTYW
jgi:broad specificity phosphatase PhoE